MLTKLSHVIESFPKTTHNPWFSTEVALTPSAVLLLLQVNDGSAGPQIVFTKRSDKVEHHKGQICFPGGMKDEADPTLWHTALRETEEELGVPAGEVRFIGELSRVVTPTGFEIAPFVGLVDKPLSFKPNQDEIDEVFCPPLPHFLDPQNIHIEQAQFEAHKWQHAVFTYQTHRIWGATARILENFLEVWKSAF